MPRGPRRKSITDVYHVIIRGNGQQLIFEDDYDRFYFLKIVKRYREEMGFELVAFCLMDNHVHLLINDLNQELDLIMKRIECSYSYYFNDKYERTGHLFQDRYKSEPVEIEKYYLTVIKYIHKNPEKAGICKSSDYRWSSYKSYLNDNSNLDNKDALAVIGGPKAFDKWMKEDDGEKCMDAFDEGRVKIKDSDAAKMACKILGVNNLLEINGYKKDGRNQALKKLKQSGLSVRQIARLTGVNRGVITRA